MEEAPKYYAVLTDAGAELEARALAEGKAVVLTHIAVGDANLVEVTPDPSATSLVHEQYRMAIDSRSRDDHDRNVTLLHATIPADAGGWWIYEQGVIGHLDGEEDEVLYAYANHARYYKVLPSEGQSLTHTVTVPIIQCTAAQVVIEIMDEGYATAEQLRSASVEAAVRDAMQAREIIRLSDRLTRHELASLAPAGRSDGDGEAQRMSPAGYPLDGAVVAPVSIVGGGAHAPAGAALVLQMEEADASS